MRFFLNENEKNLKGCSHCGQVSYELIATYSEIFNDKYLVWIFILFLGKSYVMRWRV